MGLKEFEELFFSEFESEARGMTRVDVGISHLGDTQIFDVLLEAVRPDVVIEVGSWMGHSANYIATKAKILGLSPRVLCVDTFLGCWEHWWFPEFQCELQLQAGRPKVYSSFLANVVNADNTDLIRPICLDSWNAAQVLSRFGVTADLIYIDASHDYDAVLNDVRNYSRLLSDRGVIFGDDAPHSPVREAVLKAAEEFGCGVIFDDKRRWIFANDHLIQAITPLSIAEVVVP